MERQLLSRKRNFSQRLSSQLDDEDRTSNIVSDTDPSPSSKRFALSIPASSSALTSIPISDPRTPRGEERRVPPVPLVDGDTFENYVIYGVGKTTKAIHKISNDVFVATRYTAEEAKKILKIFYRIENARNWYHEVDIEDMCNRIIPRETEILRISDDEYILFTPSIQESVHTFASERCERITEKEVFNIFYQLAKIVNFCHTIGLIVRDMKPRRMLLKRRYDAYTLIINSIQDFIILDDPENDMLRDRFLSPAFVPPELLIHKNEPYSGKASDIWGMGVLLYMLIVGRFPFYDKTPAAVFRKIRRANVVFPQVLLPRAHTTLVCQLLEKLPENRPTAEAILQFEFPAGPGQCRSKAQASMGDLFRKGEYLLDLLAASCPQEEDTQDLIHRRERLLRGPLRNELRKTRREINGQLRVDELEIKNILKWKRAQFEDRAQWPDVVFKIAVKQLAIIKRLFRKESEYEIDPTTLRMSDFPNELLLPPEIYPPREDFRYDTNGLWFKTYNVLQQYDRLKFPSFRYNGVRFDFKTKVHFNPTFFHK